MSTNDPSSLPFRGNPAAASVVRINAGGLRAATSSEPLRSTRRRLLGPTRQRGCSVLMITTTCPKCGAQWQLDDDRDLATVATQVAEHNCNPNGQHK